MRDTIEMAREAGVSIRGHYDETGSTPQELERLVELVRADERKIVMSQPLTKEMWQRFEDEIRADERETCAKVADGYVGADPIADAIRARGETK
jgi:hypothetical protein